MMVLQRELETVVSSASSIVLERKWLRILMLLGMASVNM